MNGNYVYPSELVKLKATKHFIERLEQRGIGVDCIPTLVRVTKDNIYCGEADGKELVNVVVRLKYSTTKYVFLCFNPRDGALKTLWFRDKKSNDGRENTGKDSEQAVRNDRPEDTLF